MVISPARGLPALCCPIARIALAARAYRALLAEFPSALLAFFGDFKNLSDKQLCVHRCTGAEATPETQMHICSLQKVLAALVG